MKKIFILFGFILFCIAILNPEQVLNYSLRGYLYVKNIEFKKVKTENYSIAYYQGGESNKETIILLHGLGGKSGSTWFALMPELAKRFNVIAPDLLLANLVENSSSDYLLDSDISLLHELIEKLSIEKATVVGISVGGWLAAKLAISEPKLCNNLILIDSAGIETELLLKKIVSKEENLGKWFYTSLFNSPPLVPSYLLNPIFKKIDKLGPLCKEFLQDNIHLSQDISRDLHRIECPTLIIWGEGDKIVPLEIGYKFNQGIKNSCLVVLSNCGHAVVWDRRDVLPKIITNYILQIKSDELGVKDCRKLYK